MEPASCTPSSKQGLPNLGDHPKNPLEDSALDLVSDIVQRYGALELLDLLPCGVSIATDISCKKIIHNSALARFLRIGTWECLSCSDEVSPAFKIFSKGKELAAEQLPIQRAAWNGERVIGDELEFLWSDGLKRTGLWSARPLRRDGKIVGAIATCEDLTEGNTVKAHTEQLRIGEAHCRTLVENLPIVIVKYDKELRCLFRSWAGDDYFKPSETAVGKTWEEAGVPEAVCRFWREKYNLALQFGRMVEFETTYTNDTGETRDWFVRVIPEIGEAGQVEAVLSVGLDITERKRLEAELLRLDRLNIIGEMAAAIAHEVRNPLTTVRGYLQMFLRKKESAEFQTQFKTMIEELDRANTIISDFLSLGKAKIAKNEYYNITDMINALLPLLRAEAFHLGHELEVELSEVPDLEINQKEIRQLILNLARNAFEAMAERGKLTIRLCLENGRVVLTLKDTGKGMPANVLVNLGKPFLSTKENGTGLGLAVCYRIAERHGARISVQTSPRGTTFSIYFALPGGLSAAVQPGLFD